MAQSEISYDIVSTVKTTITIHFADGSEIDIPTSDPDQTDLDNYCTSIKLKEQMYKVSSTNIIGNIASNTFDIIIQSKNGLLVPSNTSSIYYGYMNETAYIDVYCHEEDSLEHITLGRYYVDTWEGAQSAEKYTEINISATNVLSRIKNLKLDNIQLRRNMAVHSYLSQVRDIIEASIDDPVTFYLGMYAGYDVFNGEACIDINNIDTSSFESVINNIAQSTLTNIWINRANILVTDWLVDDSGINAVMTIDGSVNTLDYGINMSGLITTSGIKLEYLSLIHI